MHELGVAMQVVDIVAQRANGARVKRVVVEVGALTAVLPDALRFCFDSATEGTVAEGATLEIIERLARAKCTSCAALLNLDRPFGRCECGCSELEWQSGDELRVFEMEVE
ncbi:MAG TPA: hydrogenase maturation nickel metallochaperone HypA [Polyangiales bacterium]|jgi:hydrogenase nickel incorporation protein HypA/HybF|nr:hydrogenase maturation nickel metallochaperone HypA [Polyangiales bacterium]